MPAAAPLPATDEPALWRGLRSGADAQARDSLLALHMPYARVVAASYFSRRFHDEIEFGDYLQFASVGLLEAMERFDPARGVQFRTFAARRMHGAILSGIERLTEKQQQIAATQRLRAQRTAAAKELAAAQAGAHPRGAEQLLQYVSEVGLGLALAWLLEGTAMVDEPARAESIPFYHQAEMRQLRERLSGLVNTLPPQERTVVRCHYLQEMPFERIASTLQLTKGRVSQIHKQALLRLRAGLADGSRLDIQL